MLHTIIDNEAMIQVKCTHRFSIFRNVCTLCLFIIWITYIYTQKNQMLICQTKVQKII